MKMAGWDGAAEFHARSPEAFVRYMKSVYASDKLVGKLPSPFFSSTQSARANAYIGCGTRFVDLVKGYEVMAGYDNLILGRAVPGQGADGILVEDRRLGGKRKAEDVEDVACKKVCVGDEGEKEGEDDAYEMTSVGEEQAEEKSDEPRDTVCGKLC